MHFRSHNNAIPSIMSTGTLSFLLAEWSLMGPYITTVFGPNDGHTEGLGINVGSRSLGSYDITCLMV